MSDTSAMQHWCPAFIPEGLKMLSQVRTSLSLQIWEVPSRHWTRHIHTKKKITHLSIINNLSQNLKQSKLFQCHYTKMTLTVTILQTHIITWSNIWRPTHLAVLISSCFLCQGAWQLWVSCPVSEQDIAAHLQLSRNLHQGCKQVLSKMLSTSYMDTGHYQRQVTWPGILLKVLEAKRFCSVAQWDRQTVARLGPRQCPSPSLTLTADTPLKVHGCSSSHRSPQPHYDRACHSRTSRGQKRVISACHMDVFSESKCLID